LCPLENEKPAILGGLSNAIQKEIHTRTHPPFMPSNDGDDGGGCDSA
jgi:hypothetical protein